MIPSWFSKKERARAAPTDGAPQARQGTAHGHDDAAVARRIFVGRQPILNSDQQIIAYELLFRGSGEAVSAAVTDNVQATSRLLINTFNNLGVERVLGEKKAFINVSAGLLNSDLLELLPHDKVVLEILEDVEPTAETVDRCRELQTRGYQLALDDFVYRRDLEPLLAIVNFVKLDVRALGEAEFAEQAHLLRGRSLRIIAEKVETQAEFRRCRSLLINYYQGYYFARPETLSMKRIDPSMERMMEIFNLVVGHAEQQLIETAFRQDVALSFNLLRYINSVGFGLRHKADNIKHALVVLGHAKLARWLSLLIVGGARPGGPQALFKTALVRARMLELMGRKRLAPADHDLLFMTGMFSLLDVLLDAPLREILPNLHLPEVVTDALLHARGRFFPYLQVTQAYENLELEKIDDLVGPLGLTVADATAAQMEAMGWAEQLNCAA